MSEGSPDNVLGAFVVLGVLVGVVWTLRKAIGHLIATIVALLVIAFFLTQPEYNSAWALVGVAMILGQILMAKEALIDKPAAERSAKQLDNKAKKAVIEMNERTVDQSSSTRTCPFCAEEIKAKAIICRFCQKELPAIAQSGRAAASKSEKGSDDSKNISVKLPEIILVIVVLFLTIRIVIND